MMRTAWLVLMLTALCGCAMSPTDLRDQGKRSAFTSAKAPLAVARCITRNAEHFQPLGGLGGPFPSNWRESEKLGAYDVLVTHPGLGGYSLVAEITPAGTGSAITTWLTPHLAYQDMSERIFAGCE